MFKELTKNIYKLDIPFDDNTTSSFLVVSQNKSILIDCGTYPEDVTEIILPALKSLDIIPDYLFLTHSHGDHAGGTDTLFKEFANLKLLCFDTNLAQKYNGILLKDNQEILKDICILSLKGHSWDSGALLDKRTNSIITGDCLQLWGISKYGCGIGMPIEYKKSIARLKNIKLDNIFASHEYYPLGSTASGSDEVQAYLEECNNFYNELILFTLSAKEKGILDAEKIAKDFGNNKIKSHPKMPTIPPASYKVILAQDEAVLKEYID